MRLFVAVEIGPDVQAAASRVIEDLKRRIAQSAPHARVTWVKTEALHLTVRFIGQASPDVCQTILAALERPLQVSAFELTIAGTGSFPPKRPPRVIWAGIASGLDQLRAVEREVRSRLEPLVPADDARSGADRDYHPHLTLGRVKVPAGVQPAVLLNGLEQAVFGRVRVGAVTLFESRLSPTGPAYVALGRTPLTS
ncbi:MAG TPA: RNA 2',3'-cyclic phosphodiesterase [Vicinamibacterales bacterium]|nr:RNA 2',3'-cyclic phosphodiesterase [Vicinamibacterales bacterium]